jgi:hypothetical protein
MMNIIPVDVIIENGCTVPRFSQRMVRKRTRVPGVNMKRIVELRKWNHHRAGYRMVHTSGSHGWTPRCGLT